MCRLLASSEETIWFGRRSSGSSVDTVSMRAVIKTCRLLASSVETSLMGPLVDTSFVGDVRCVGCQRRR